MKRKKALKNLKKRNIEFFNKWYFIIWAALLVFTFVIISPITWNLALLSLLIVSSMYHIIYIISYEVLKNIK